MWLTDWYTDSNMWLTHQLEKDVGCEVLLFIHMIKIKKLIGYKTLDVQMQQFLQEKDELR